jgi:hypothetical protein
MGLDTKTDLLTDRQSQYYFDYEQTDYFEVRIVFSGVVNKKNMKCVVKN